MKYSISVSEHQTQLTDFSHSDCFRWHMIEVHAQLRSTSPIVRWSDLVQVFIAKLQLPLLGTSWPIIEVQAHLRTSILWSITFLDIYEINFDKLQFIMYISSLPSYASEWLISHWRTCTQIHACLVYNFIHFTGIMFSSTFIQWKQYT